MSYSQSTRIALLVENSSNRLDLFALLVRDQNILINNDWCFSRAESLVAWLRSPMPCPHVIFVDTLAIGHIGQKAQWLSDTVKSIRAACPCAAIICISDQIDPDLAKAAVNAKANGLLLRRELGYGAGVAAKKSSLANFICTKASHAFVQRHLPKPEQTICLQSWQLYKKLTPAECRVAKYFYLQGYSSEISGQLSDIKRTSVTIYKQRIRNKLQGALEEGFYEISPQIDVGINQRLSDDEVFFLLTRLPLAQ